MQLSANIIATLLLASTQLLSTSALAIGNLTLAHSLEARGDLKTPTGVSYSIGKCVVKSGEDHCEIKGVDYSCINSACRQSDIGAPCTLADSDNFGGTKAKCPLNLVEYEWDWPWVDCKDPKNKNWGTCKQK